MTDHPLFWIMAAAVAAPLLAEIPVGVRMPTVVIEVLLGIVIGPQVLGLAHFNDFVETMFGFAMAMTLFMGGMELDLHAIRGRPLSLAIGGWLFSLVLGLAALALLHALPRVHAPMLVALGLCTTGLGVLIPVFRDSGQLETALGRMALAAGALGELGPIVAMSLILSGRYSTWQELAYLLAFLAAVAAAMVIGMRARPPKLMTFLSRHLHASAQLPVRLSLLLLGGMFLVADRLGFESVLGAFAAGMVIGQATQGEGAKPFRHKLDAVAFGWFYPFFFIGTGLKFNVEALGADLTTMLLVLLFLPLFLLVRGLPVLVGYRSALAPRERLPMALSSAVPSLSIIVVITEIGVRTHSMSTDMATALVGAALLAVLLFPTLANALSSAQEGRSTASA
jgi:Kef-type K+ transport system membrane component KefB